MKAERRHELKENDLLEFIEQSRARLQGHGKTIGLVAVGVIAAIALVKIVLGTRAAAIEDRWRQRAELKFDAADDVGRQSLKTLAALTESASDPCFVLTGLFDQGTIALKLARLSGAVPDRALNQQAKAAFEELLRRFSDNPLAFGVAHSGLATVEENEFASDGDMAHKERARGHLTAIIENPKLHGTPLATSAIDRRNALDKTFTRITFAPPLPPPPPEPAAEATPTPTPVPVQPISPPAITITPAEGKPVTPPAEESPPKSPP